MPYCRKCGAELGNDEKFCSTCGTSVAPQQTETERRRRAERRPISTAAIALIIVVVAVSAIAVAFSWFYGLGPFRPSRIIGSESMISEQKIFSGFTNVEVGYAFEVEITQAASYSIKITADDNVLKYVRVSTIASSLKIDLEPGIIYQSVTLKAEITMPELHELMFSGATRGTVEGFASTHVLVLVLSGGSSLDMMDMSAGDVVMDISGASRVTGSLQNSGDAQCDVSGASTVELEGEANDLLIYASGASGVDLSEYPVYDANVDLSGGSQATINLDGRLDADLSGGSRLLYIGEPTMGNISLSGGSTVGKK